MKVIDLYQRLNIPPKQLRKFCQQWNIIELSLFGSILRDDFYSHSDIDVLVSFAPNVKITFFDLHLMETQLSQLCNRPVDVISKRAILRSHNWIRRKNILDNAQVIYEHR